MQQTKMLEEIQNAMRAHGMWKLKLKTAISSGGATLDVDVVTRDGCCDFGKWMYSISAPEMF